MDFQPGGDDYVHCIARRAVHGRYYQDGMSEVPCRGFCRVYSAVPGRGSDICDIGNQAEDFGLVMVKKMLRKPKFMWKFFTFS